MKWINEVVHGNCLQLTKELDDGSIDGVVIDPPFGEGFSYAGDRSSIAATTLLDQFLRIVYPKLKPEGHLAIFWAMRHVDLCIEAVKKNYTFRRLVTMYMPSGEARPYLGWLPRTQAIVIGQKYTPGVPSDLHWEFAAYLQAAMESLDYTRQRLADILGCSYNLVRKWTQQGNPQWCLPTPVFYEQLKKVLDLDDQYDFMLTRQSVFVKAPLKGFSYKHDCYILDEKHEELLHPAQKPLSVVSHIVECIAPKDGVVLDAFAGSGTTALGALATKRNFICFEVSEQFCDVARRRIAEVNVKL